MSDSSNANSQRTLLLAAVAMLVPLLFAVLLLTTGAAPAGVKSGESRFPASRLPFEKVELGKDPRNPDLIANVQVVDFDGDGLPDVLACDARRNRVVWYRQSPRGTWNEQLVCDVDLPAPARAELADLDGDGDNDLLVAVLGSIWPTDARVGQVVWLRNDGSEFKPVVLLDDVRRVADVEPGDLDGDGDLDLAVAVFGYDQGRILWLENRGGNRFRDHVLMVTPGCSHVPLGDYDGDGDLDVMALVSQEEEEVWGFQRTEGGTFTRHRVYFSYDFDLGSAGLIKTDLDADGDLDLLLAAGDNLETTYHYPQPGHGCIWLENQGSWRFAARRIARCGGVYAAAVGDFDQDGDRDVALASMFNDWARPGAASLVWLENDGHTFRPWQIDSQPIYLATLASGDLDGDGHDDLVAGSLHLASPWNRLGGVTAWLNRGGGPP